MTLKPVLYASLGPKPETRVILDSHISHQFINKSNRVSLHNRFQICPFSSIPPATHYSIQSAITSLQDQNSLLLHLSAPKILPPHNSQHYILKTQISQQQPSPQSPFTVSHSSQVESLLPLPSTKPTALTSTYACTSSPNVRFSQSHCHKVGTSSSYLQSLPGSSPCLLLSII